MRLSSRLTVNAVSTYLRLGTTFVIGIFMTWYLIDQIGLIGLGMVSLAMGAMGMSAVDNAIRQSIIRDLAAALAGGPGEGVPRVLISTLAFCALVACGMVLFFVILAFIAAADVLFKTPLPGVLAWLFVAEGAVVALGLLAAPFTQSLLAAQRVSLDNALIVVQRLVNATAAVLALSVIWPNGPLETRLLGYAAVRTGLVALELAGEVLLARSLLADLRLRRSSFDREHFRAVAGTVWHTGQVTLTAAINLNAIGVLINVFFGITFNGVWHVVIQVGGHVRMLGLGMLRGIDALAAHLLGGGKHRTLVVLMSRAIRYQLLAMLPVAAAYGIFIVPVLDLWVGGRLAGDEGLERAGIGVGAAIGLTALMAVINAAAEVLRMGTLGVERMLYGMGEVRSYAWFASYTWMLAIGGAALVMWLTGSPALAPLPLLIVNLIYSWVVILRAASRRAGLPVRATLSRSLARPIVVAALLAIPLALLRLELTELTVWTLLALAAGTAAATALLVYAIGLEPDERDRVREMTVRTLNIHHRGTEGHGGPRRRK